MKRLDDSVRTRDGVRIAYTAWLPADTGPFPAAVVRTPYGRQRFENGRLAPMLEEGYAVVAVDVRGRGDSEGVWRPWVNDGYDGYDVIEGIAEQPWCDGNVATFGGSYDAVTQWWAAVHHPPHLRCMVAMAVSPLREPHSPRGRSNGAVMPYWLWWLRFLEVQEPNTIQIDWPAVLRAPVREMARVAGTAEQPWHAYLDGEIGYGEPSWGIDPLEVDVPVLVTNGWWDDPKTFELWEVLERSPRARDHQLIAGAWDHVGNSDPKPVLGGIDVSGGIMDPLPHRLAFLNRWTKPHVQPAAPEPRIRIARTGSWQWETPAAWPSPDRAPRSYSLARGTWKHDPADVLTLGGNTDLAWADAPLDPREMERRDDVLLVDLPVSTAPMRITGRPRVELEVSQASEGTVVCWLSDISPDGSGLRFGVWPTAVHHPGGTHTLSLSLAALHHELQPGHHFRIGLASSYAPIYAHAREPMLVRLEQGTLTLDSD